MQDIILDTLLAGEAMLRLLHLQGYSSTCNPRVISIFQTLKLEMQECMLTAFFSF